MASIRLLAGLFVLLPGLLQPNSIFGQQQMVDGNLNVEYFTPRPTPYLASEVFEATPDSLHGHPEFGRNPFNVSCEDCFEVLQERTPDSRLYYKRGSEGKVMYRQQFYGAAHYVDETGKLVTIDHTLQPEQPGSKRFAAMQQPIPVAIDLETGYNSLTLRNGFEFRYNAGTTLKFIDRDGNLLRDFGPMVHGTHTAGDDGVVAKDIWPGIDRQSTVQRGEIKTDYVVKQRPTDWPGEGFLVIEDYMAVPDDYVFKASGDGIVLNGNDWYGAVVMEDANGLELLQIKRPMIIDYGATKGTESYPISYQWERQQGRVVFRILVDLEWMTAPERQYPILIDPRVLGSNDYNAGVMGFQFAPTCFSAGTYCSYPLQVVVPGKSTITNAWFWARYYSHDQGCGVATICRKKDAAFQMIGPCGTSPASGFWTCDSSSIISTIPGLCYGDSIWQNFRHTVTLCLPPSCPDHIVDFEMRTFHCSCPLSQCDTACHIMYTGTWSITIEARTLEGDLQDDKTICPGDSVTLFARGFWGVPPYTYTWAHSSDSTSIVKVGPITPTTYYVTITDQCGEFVTDSAFIDIRQQPTVALSRINALCSSGSDGSATAVGGGTQAPYNYRWNTSPQQTTATASNLRPGSYTVTVTDNFGCTVVDSINVGYTNLMAINAVVEDVSCYGFADGSISLAPQGTTPFIYEWDDQDASSSKSNLPPGTYRVTVTDAIGCFDTLTIQISQPDSFWVDAGPDHVILKGTTVQLNGAVIPPGSSYIYRWIPATGLNDPLIPDPRANPDTTTLYVFRASQPNNPDCYSEDSLVIYVQPLLNVTVPNAFTPNGDGVNDIFIPVGEAFIDRIQVFNRWGELVYDGQTGWDGTLGGVPQPMGTYAYLITVRQPLSDKVFLFKGNVTLIR